VEQEQLAQMKEQAEWLDNEAQSGLRAAMAEEEWCFHQQIAALTIYIPWRDVIHSDFLERELVVMRSLRVINNVIYRTECTEGVCPTEAPLPTSSLSGTGPIVTEVTHERSERLLAWSVPAPAKPMAEKVPLTKSKARRPRKAGNRLPGAWMMTKKWFMDWEERGERDIICWRPGGKRVRVTVKSGTPGEVRQIQDRNPDWDTQQASPTRDALEDTNNANERQFRTTFSTTGAHMTNDQSPTLRIGTHKSVCRRTVTLGNDFVQSVVLGHLLLYLCCMNEVPRPPDGTKLPGLLLG